jgi:uroporphyrinogen decarboxylase
MNPRERFRAVVHFKEPDRLPVYEWVSIPDDTILRWLKEGMELEKAISREELFIRGELLSVSCYRLFAGHQPLVFDILDHMDEIPIDFGPIPRFGPRTLEESERYRVLIDAGGVKKRVFKDRQFGMPQFIEWPVKGLKDWRRIQERFKAEDPRRYPLDWSDEAIEYFRTTSFPTRIRVPGFFGFGRQLMGLMPWLIAFYRDQELVQEMEAFWADFLIETLKPAVEALKSSIDCVTIWEDMAYRKGPHISPRLFKDFLMSGYKRLTGFLRHYGIETILTDSDGNIIPLVPLFIEAGVKGLYPLEVQAGMDAIALRKAYGRSLILIGNIDKRAVALGKDSIEREIRSKLPFLKKEGGYIPSLDHEVPPDVPYQNYCYYLEFLKKYL